MDPGFRRDSERREFSGGLVPSAGYPGGSRGPSLTPSPRVDLSGVMAGLDPAIQPSVPPGSRPGVTKGGIGAKDEGSACFPALTAGGIQKYENKNHVSEDTM